MSRWLGTRPLGWGIGLLACTGLVAGHGLGYVLAEPHGHERAALLEATGHGPLWVVVAVALGMLVRAVAAVTLARAVPTHPSSRPWVGPAFARLSGLQVASFLVLEGIERHVSFEAAMHIIAEPAVMAGICAQLVVAFVAAVAYVVVVRRRAIVRRAPYRVPARRVLSLGEARPRLATSISVARAAWNRRGPPVAILLRH